MVKKDGNEMSELSEPKEAATASRAWIGRMCDGCVYAFFEDVQGICREGPPTPMLVPLPALSARVIGGPVGTVQIGSSYSVVSRTTLACSRWYPIGVYGDRNHE